MGAEKLPREKINVRSPFFITVDGEGAPDLTLDCPVETPGDPVPVEPVVIQTPTDPVEVPEEYVQPDAKTEEVYCGDTVNVGTDVGVTRYKLEVGDITGDVTVNYTINTPISIIGFWNTTVPDFSSTGYVGNDDFEQDLLDAGISAGSMNLTPGVATGSVTVNKTDASPSTVTILVSAPLPTDDYSLTFNCPSAPAIVPDPAPPVSQVLPNPGHSKLIENIPMWGLGSSLISGSTVKLEVNGVTVSESLDFSKLYYFSDYDPTVELGISGGEGKMRAVLDLPDYSTATRFDKSTYFKEGINEVVFTINSSGNGGVIRNFNFFRGGAFYANSQWNYANPRSSIQLGNEVGYFPRGINNTNNFKYSIETGVSTRDNRKLSPLKVMFFYDTGATFASDNLYRPEIVKTEGLIQPVKFSNLIIRNFNASQMSGYELRNGYYYHVHARGEVTSYNLAPFGRSTQIK